MPSGIRNNHLNYFFTCKLICWNPAPFPSCDFQPYCTGSAVLWVRSFLQIGDTWAAGVWLFIQTERVGGMKPGFLLQVIGDWHIFIYSKCNEFVAFICVFCTPISERNCLFGFLFVFPEPLNRVQTQICSSGCCLLDFLLWKIIGCLTGWWLGRERKESQSGGTACTYNGSG